MGSKRSGLVRMQFYVRMAQQSEIEYLRPQYGQMFSQVPGSFFPVLVGLNLLAHYLIAKRRTYPIYMLEIHGQ